MALKLEAGKYYRTRDGREAYVIGPDPIFTRAYNIWAVSLGGRLYHFHAMGNFYDSGSNLETRHDLIEEWKDTAIERYITLCSAYKDADEAMLYTIPPLVKNSSAKVIKLRIDPHAQPGERVVEMVG